ncbi:hypothetical protein HPB48_012834 [Haemaphysalis longicornis]|uniref:Uncharacterized protein n=1 Tax=Haemaphysalis longicornis TaxID=44386 RepID=A0A9J6FP24_HAELO|nr:hypothetical protein HPB48_012834 [Haemaphysalis longicornis]
MAQPAGIVDASTDARKRRAQSAATFRNEPTFHEASTEPSTNDLLACAQLSLGVLTLHLQSMLLLAPPTDHWCKRPPEFANQSAHAWKNAAIPLGPDGRHSQRAVYRFHYFREPGGGPAWSFSVPEELHYREWEFYLPDGVSTVVSEGLVWAPFLGTTTGPLGRRPLILAGVVAALSGAAQTVNAPAFFHFIVSRMLVVAALAGCSLTSLVLLFKATSEASRCTASAPRLLAKE